MKLAEDSIQQADQRNLYSPICPFFFIVLTLVPHGPADCNPSLSSRAMQVISVSVCGCLLALLHRLAFQSLARRPISSVQYYDRYGIGFTEQLR